MKTDVLEKFRLEDKVVIITGGAGLLGQQHAEAVVQAGGIAVLFDINRALLDSAIERIGAGKTQRAFGYVCDITKSSNIKKCLGYCIKKFGRVDALINNAANNPKVDKNSKKKLMRFENLPESVWNNDIAVGLTGAFLCSQVIGTYMSTHGGGVILNIASDLAIIAPDQRIYRKKGLLENNQSVKPVTYSVVKTGLIGLTKYLATYWATSGIRVNALCPGGLYNGQPDDFVKRLSSLIPMGRMAKSGEYQAAILFLLSDASSYMTGASVIMDGGRSVW